MSAILPEQVVPVRPRPAAGPDPTPWDHLPSLVPFRLADESGPARQQTRVRLCCDAVALYVRFDCEDRDIWCTHTERDAPLHEEEAVEVFLAPGEKDPTRYFEFQVNPRGALFDGIVHHPGADRESMTVDRSWDCPGLRWNAGSDPAAGRWWACLSIPRAAVTPEGLRPSVWRANFYRIERPGDGQPEFSCWSPTLTQPPDFHKPARFGRLLFA